MPNRQRNFPKTNARAKRLRREPTPAEGRLWNLLGKIEGFHFRRQSPIGPYTFDFAEQSEKLLIEVDGGIHDLPEVQKRDEEKERWAQSQGFRVLRIPNTYDFGTGEPAIAMIMAELKQPGILSR